MLELNHTTNLDAYSSNHTFGAIHILSHTRFIVFIIKINSITNIKAHAIKNEIPESVILHLKGKLE